MDNTSGKSCGCVELQPPTEEQIKVADELIERIEKLKELPIEELQKIFPSDKLRQCVSESVKILTEELDQLLKMKLENHEYNRIDERINAICNILRSASISRHP
jgi:hypothetical protein